MARRRRKRTYEPAVSCWHDSAERLVFAVGLTSYGEPYVRPCADPDAVGPADRERAAWWLSNQFPGMPHDDAYEFLWEG